MKEFVPIDEPVISSRELELNFHDQQELALQMSRTSGHLADIPDLRPKQTDVVLDHIPSRGLLGDMGPGNEIGLYLSETDIGKRSATISIAEKGRPTFKFQLAAATNMWEEWRPRQKKPTHYVETGTLLALLSTRFKDSGFVEGLIDSTNLDTMAMIHLLASHLKSSARTQERLVRYSVVNPIETVDYSSSVETTLSLKETRWKRIQRLAVTSAYAIGSAEIQKQYSYTTSATARSIRGVGHVNVSSKDGIQKNRLDSYAAADQDDNDPIDTLNTGLLNLRTGYNLYDEKQHAT